MVLLKSFVIHFMWDYPFINFAHLYHLCIYTLMGIGGLDMNIIIVLNYSLILSSNPAIHCLQYIDTHISHIACDASHNYTHRYINTYLQLQSFRPLYLQLLPLYLGYIRLEMRSDCSVAHTTQLTTSQPVLDFITGKGSS